MSLLHTALTNNVNSEEFIWWTFVTKWIEIYKIWVAELNYKMYDSKLSNLSNFKICNRSEWKCCDSRYEIRLKKFQVHKRSRAQILIMNGTTATRKHVPSALCNAQT